MNHMHTHNQPDVTKNKNKKQTCALECCKLIFMHCGTKWFYPEREKNQKVME